MLNKSYRVYPKAVEDLENIYLYGYNQFGLKRAESYIKDIEAGFQQIANNPEIARNCDYIRNKLRSWFVGSHVIFFKPIKNEIVIIRVLHKSMDYIRHL